MPVDRYWWCRSSLCTETAGKAGVRALTTRRLPSKRRLYNYFVERLRRGQFAVGTSIFRRRWRSVREPRLRLTLPYGHGGLEQEMIETYGYARTRFWGIRAMDLRQNTLVCNVQFPCKSPVISQRAAGGSEPSKVTFPSSRTSTICTGLRGGARLLQQYPDHTGADDAHRRLLPWSRAPNCRTAT